MCVCVVMSSSPEHFPQEGMVYLNFDRAAVVRMELPVSNIHDP